VLTSCQGIPDEHAHDTIPGSLGRGVTQDRVEQAKVAAVQEEQGCLLLAHLCNEGVQVRSRTARVG